MTLHSWQQNQYYITKKLGENVAIKVLILGWQKWQNPAFLTKFLTKSAFFDERKMTFWRQNLLKPTDIASSCFLTVGIKESCVSESSWRQVAWLGIAKRVIWWAAAYWQPHWWHRMAQVFCPCVLVFGRGLSFSVLLSAVLNSCISEASIHLVDLWIWDILIIGTNIFCHVIDIQVNWWANMQ